MAHECPDCWHVCYCGGDIDDLVFYGTPSEDACTHYLKCRAGDWRDRDEDEHDEPDDRENEAHV